MVLVPLSRIRGMRWFKQSEICFMATTRQKPMPDNYNPAMVEAGSDGKFGMFILKDGVKGVVKKPSWNGTLTVFRPFPCLSYEDPSNAFEPYRVDPTGRNVFGPWIRRYDCAWSVGVGTNKITFLLGDPATTGPGFDPYNTPLGILYRAVENACKKGHARTAEWQPLREGGAGKGKALVAPTSMYLMQGVILVIDSKPQYGQGKVPIGWAKDGPTCFFAMSKGLGEKLVAELSKKTDGYKGDLSNFEAAYVNGDPVSVNSGRYLFIFQKGHDPRNKFGSQPTEQVQSWAEQSDEVGGAGGKGSGGFEDKGFDLYLDKVCNGMPATLNRPDQIDKIRQKWCFWRESLYFPTFQEQARMLWGVFPKSACVYAWDGHNKDWISPEMWAEFRGAVSLSVPGGVPGDAPVGGPVNNEDAWGGGFADAFAAEPGGGPIVDVVGAVAGNALGGQDTVAPPATLPDGAGVPIAGDPFATDETYHPAPAQASQAAPVPSAGTSGFDAPPAQAAQGAAADPKNASAVAKLALARARGNTAAK